MELGAEDPRFRVPGFPQDMQMTMYTEEQLSEINKPETRGMRRYWYKDIAGLMTVVRILPEDLFEQVASGRGDIPYGASVPGAGGGEEQMQHLQHNAAPRPNEQRPARGAHQGHGG